MITTISSRALPLPVRHREAAHLLRAALAALEEAGQARLAGEGPTAEAWAMVVGRRAARAAELLGAEGR